jgi:hypothetical protein
MVGFISGSSLNIWFMFSLFNMLKDDLLNGRNHFGFDWRLVFGPYIHANRNQLQDEFMQTEFEWLFMVDNDMCFEPRDVWLLFEEAKKQGPGIYSAPYIIEDGYLVCGSWDAEVPMAYHNLVMLPEHPTEIGVVGAGFTLIHRNVFEAIGEKAFASIIATHGEDVSFCWRAREAGYTPVLVPECNPGHFKQVTLYPDQSVRNMVNENVNLVQIDASHQEPLETVGKGGDSK